MSYIAPVHDGGDLHRRYLPLAFITGVASLLVAVAIQGTAIAVVTSFVRAVEAGPRGCLPTDFPTYPGAQLTGVSIDFGSPSGCSVENVVDARQSDVADYYTANLNTGGWQVTETDASSGDISFERTSDPSTYGRVQLSTRHAQTVVDIDLVRG